MKREKGNPPSRKATVGRQAIGTPRLRPSAVSSGPNGSGQAGTKAKEVLSAE